jgi:hypothetical protein
MITQEELKSLLSYDPETGEFTWLISKGSRAVKGSKAGSVCQKHGYAFIRLNKKLYRTHHLVWIYCFGIFPSLDIDHINQKRSDNRLSNLREVSRSVNNYNTTKRKGYTYRKERNKYYAYINIGGKQRSLGLFQTEEQAKEAYEQAKSSLN